MPLPFNPPPPRSQLTELEKKREENIRRNEEMLISLGLLAPNGSFFQAKKRSKQLLMESESESSEDEEWTPQAEWQKRMKKQPRTSFDEVERYKAKAAKAGATKKQHEDDDNLDHSVTADQYRDDAAADDDDRGEKAASKNKPLVLEPEDTPNLACPMLISPDPADVVEGDTVTAESESCDGKRVRYPRRQAASKVSYNEAESDDDEYIYCEDCDDWFRGDCPNCGPLQPLNSEAMGSKPVRSQHTSLLIPPEIRIGKSKIAGAGMGAFAKTFIPKGTRIGPYTGDVVEEDGLNPERDSSYMWEVAPTAAGKKRLVDGKSEKHANWMRFVNCARNEEEQNFVAYQYKGEIYYRSFRDIRPHDELLVWYGKEYAVELGISMESASSLQTSEPNQDVKIEPNRFRKPQMERTRKVGPRPAPKGTSPEQPLLLSGLIRKRPPYAAQHCSMTQTAKQAKVIPDPNISTHTTNTPLHTDNGNESNRVYVPKSEVKRIIQLTARKKELKCKACGVISK
eukprot:scpid67503/ scgid0852/ Histone-lysine N-methyltransferase PRDM9; PR domain zinc finger protein 9; PR domain-containing protein 9